MTDHPETPLIADCHRHLRDVRRFVSDFWDDLDAPLCPMSPVHDSRVLWRDSNVVRVRFPVVNTDE